MLPITSRSVFLLDAELGSYLGDDRRSGARPANRNFERTVGL